MSNIKGSIWEAHLLITARTHHEVLNDPQVGLDVQQVGYSLTATQLQHELKQNTSFSVIVLNQKDIFKTTSWPPTLALSLSRSCALSRAVSSSGASSVTNDTNSSTLLYCATLRHRTTCQAKAHIRRRVGTRRHSEGTDKRQPANRKMFKQ